MKIRVYETDFEGNPVECTGEFFSGPTALAIVEAMKMSPFTASLDPLAFMRQILDRIGQQDFKLPGPPEQAAAAAKTVKPKVLFPYHYSQTPIQKVADLLAGTGIDVRIRAYQ